MADKATIKAGITKRIGTSKYTSWRIGLTHDLAERKKTWKETEKQNVDSWTWWEAESLTDAQNIEAHFIALGMKGGTGGDLKLYKTVYVYIF